MTSFSSEMSTETIGYRYVVSGLDNRLRLPVGTILEEERRFEGWDHHGCIDSIRSVVAIMRIRSGPRTDEAIEVVLQSGYEYDPPFASAVVHWLNPLAVD